MQGFGSAKFSQGTFGKGVQQGFVKPASTADVQVANHAIWTAYPTGAINAVTNVDVFGGQQKGAFMDIEATGTMYSYPNGIVWAGWNKNNASATTLIFGYVAWDGQNVSDTTWTPFHVD